jgi:hypothetical protein
MEKREKVAGSIVLVLLIVFGTLSTFNFTSQPKASAGEVVQGDKQDLFETAQNLCASKKQESLDSIVLGTGSAEQLGRVIDQLSTTDGCYTFSAQVLLDEIEVKK